MEVPDRRHRCVEAERARDPPLRIAAPKASRWQGVRKATIRTTSVQVAVRVKSSMFGQIRHCALSAARRQDGDRHQPSHRERSMIAGGMRGRTAITHRLRVTIRSAERRLFMRLKQRDFRATCANRNSTYHSLWATFAGF